MANKFAPEVTLEIVDNISNDVVLILPRIPKSTKIYEIKKLIFENLNIYVKRQEIYLGGELLDDNNDINYYGKFVSTCKLSLQSKIDLLLSTLECPGPCVLSIGVDLLNRERIVSIKEKIYFKTGIEIDHLHLFVHPKTMTSYHRRCELRDNELLSLHMNPKSRDNFLEAIVSEHNDVIEENKSLFIRLPITKPQSNDEHRIRPPWLTLILTHNEIIKQDPKVSDVMNLLKEELRNKELQKVCDLNPEDVVLKFVGHRTVFNKEIAPDCNIYRDFFIRSKEKLIFVNWKNLARNFNDDEVQAVNSIFPLQPLLPLKDYNAGDNLHTMPRDPFGAQWDVNSDSTNFGAKPIVEFEFSAISYNRECGSWDIIKHIKNYVEIIIEGSAMPNPNKPESSDKIGCYYYNKELEITILGPELPKNYSGTDVLLPKSQLGKISKNELKNLELEDQIMTGFPHQASPLFYPSPIRYEKRPIKYPKTIPENIISTVRPGHTKYCFNKWYISKEKVTSITEKTNKVISSCERGFDPLNRPFVRVKYTEDIKDDQPLHFRIQTLFFKCQRMDEKSIKKSVDITVQIRHKVIKVIQQDHLSDIVAEYQSPAHGCMVKTIPIKLK